MSAHVIGFDEERDEQGNIYRRAVCRCGWASEYRRSMLTPTAAASAHLRGWLR